MWFVHFVLMSILWGLLHIRDIGLNLSAEGGGYACPFRRLQFLGDVAHSMVCWVQFLRWLNFVTRQVWDAWETTLGVVVPKGIELKHFKFQLLPLTLILMWALALGKICSGYLEHLKTGMKSPEDFSHLCDVCIEVRTAGQLASCIESSYQI